MSRNYKVSTRINRPVEDVFDAIVSKQRQVCYFTDESSDDLIKGKVITWFWKHWGENRVTVTSVDPNKRVELSINSIDWQKSEKDSYDVKVIFEFEALKDGTTHLSISEEGWKTDSDGLKASHENCEGWAHMCACLKAYMEHGIDLR